MSGETNSIVMPTTESKNEALRLRILQPLACTLSGLHIFPFESTDGLLFCSFPEHDQDDNPTTRPQVELGESNFYTRKTPFGRHYRSTHDYLETKLEEWCESLDISKRRDGEDFQSRKTAHPRRGARLRSRTQINIAGGVARTGSGGGDLGGGAAWGQERPTFQLLVQLEKGTTANSEPVAAVSIPLHRLENSSWAISNQHHPNSSL